MRQDVYSRFSHDPENTAAMHMTGERLAAALFDAMLDENGIPSRFIDFSYEEFPVIVRGDNHNARMDYAASREAASRLKESNKSRFIVLPGYGGIDKMTRKQKTLGRGGSDTSAMGNMYAFQASGLWMLTDVPGILRYSGLKNDAREGDVVGRLDVNETKDAASLGAKLPGRKAVEGAEKCFAEGGNPEIYITRDTCISGPRTRIISEDPRKETVKLVAGRNVILYEIEGDVKGLQNILTESGVEYRAAVSSDWALLVVPEYDGSSKAYTDGVLGRLLGKRADVRVKCYTDFAWIGVVGNGMDSQNGRTYRQEAMGVAARATAALNDVPIVHAMDPGKVSLGYVVPRDYSKRAQEALYNEFLG